MTKKHVLIGILIVSFISTVSGDFYYNDRGGTITADSDYFTTPEFDSQQEIATGLVAPFIFISVLLHFALSRALNFIMAEDVEDQEYHRLPYAIPLRDRGHGTRPDARRYAMIMSLTITASLIPTPYWGWIRSLMSLLGLGVAVAFAAIVGFVVYLMLQMT